MEKKGFHRKLTAILSADVAGYSRLMQGCISIYEFPKIERRTL
jgi:hypothetical protein